MRGAILVLNAGSSSVKFSLFRPAPDRSLAALQQGQIEDIGAAARLRVEDASGRTLIAEATAAGDQEQAIAAIHRWLGAHAGGETQLGGVGHRIVHGGTQFAQPVRIDAQVIEALERLVPLAPLHQPHHIAAIRAVQAAAPQVPQVACFDTAFHRAQPPLAQQFALPRSLTAQGVRRYGFHGLSYEYIVATLAQAAPEAAGGRVVIAHLGAGASMCAVHQGRSVATTMSFTPLDGLPMGTRSGALDPGVILYLLQHERMSTEALEQLLYQRSGLLGVSGVSADMRTLLASERREAREAVDLFVYRIGRELGSLTAALGGLDTLVFTGGIGEHAASIRARVCDQARWLGVSLDERANERGEQRISHTDSRVAVWMLPTDENLMVARHTRRLLDAQDSGP